MEPSTTRRSLLGGGAAALGGTAALAGCSALSNGPPAADPPTGVPADSRAALDRVPVFLAGDTGDLPTPPTVADSLDAAEVALATPDADHTPLAAAFREGTTVAFADGNEFPGDGTAASEGASVSTDTPGRDGAPAALAALLDAVGDEYSYGTETVEGRPLGPAVATPRGDVAHTYQFVREGGWDHPVLDPLGWAVAGRLPDCPTFVPERSDDAQFAPAGRAWLAGRLPSGEFYAARTDASRYDGATGDGDEGPSGDPNEDRPLRLRTTLHAASNDGYAVAEARRVADFPNDEQLRDWFPNPHERGGVAVSNHSDPVEERLDVSFAPADDRARRALTGCCGVTVDGSVGYDHRTTWEWARDGLLATDRRHGGGSGRGEWHVRP